jgi:putative solute:sodium symporter small subunit
MAKSYKEYWTKNKFYLTVLLITWFVFSYLAGIIFVDELNSIRLGGFKLGFWIAQQGAIYLYVGLIFIYVLLMNRLDKKHNLDEK